MTNRPKYSSSIGRVIADYVSLKQALGRRFHVQEYTLRSLDSFLCTYGDGSHDLDATSFDAWRMSMEHCRSTVRRHRMLLVRSLCLYRQRSEPSCFVPSSDCFPACSQAVRPHIFTDAEIVRLIRATRSLTVMPFAPFRAATFRLAIILLYTTGLRRGELIRLTIGDVDLDQRLLHVRASKFHKSRDVPILDDATKEIEAYLKCRRSFRPRSSPAEPFLTWNVKGPAREYSGHAVWRVIQQLFQTAAIHKRDGHLPRVHDLRHSMAVNALVRWYREGVDVQAKLPLLAAYLGHVSILSTEYYLHFIEDVATLASDRFAQQCGEVVTAHQSRGAP